MTGNHITGTRTSSGRLRSLAMAGLILVVVASLAACTSGGGSPDHQSAQDTPSGGSTPGTGSSTTTSGGGSKYAYGTLPAESGKPKKGGVVKIAEPPGAGPTYIFPIINATANSVFTEFEFQWLMFRPLYWYPTGAVPEINKTLSLAKPPKYSNDNKTVTIHLKKTYTWADGKPVDANDVLFDIDLIKAAIKENPSNFAAYTPGQFPDNIVQASVTGKYTIKLQLDKSYNPAWFTNNQLTSITPLPSTAWNIASDNGAHLDYTKPRNAKAIYNYLDKESSQPATFATNPLWQNVDGPFKLKSFTASTGANTMVPNPKYTGPQKPHIDALKEVAFTSSTALFNQLKAGNLTAAPLAFSDLPQVEQLKQEGYNVYGLPSHGFSFIMLNFKDKTNHVDDILGQLYIRQALAHLIDKDSLISSKAVYNGAAAPSYGSVPAIPPSRYTPEGASKPVYPFDVDKAKELLTSHGWDVQPGGQTTCQRPGSGADQCGKGIPKGQAIKFNLFYRNESVHKVISNAFASAAKQVGITISTRPKTFSYMISHFNNPASPSTADDWAMENWGGLSITPYPTANSVFNTTGSTNVGSYSNPKADKLIQKSVFGSNPLAVKHEGAFLRKNLPVLWLPQPDSIWVWKKSLSGPPESFAALTQSSLIPEYWYYTK